MLLRRPRSSSLSVPRCWRRARSEDMLSARSARACPCRSAAGPPRSPWRRRRRGNKPSTTWLSIGRTPIGRRTFGCRARHSRRCCSAASICSSSSATTRSPCAVAALDASPAHWSRQWSSPPASALLQAAHGKISRARTASASRRSTPASTRSSTPSTRTPTSAGRSTTRSTAMTRATHLGSTRSRATSLARASSCSMDASAHAPRVRDQHPERRAALAAGAPQGDVGAARHPRQRSARERVPQARVHVDVWRPRAVKCDCKVRRVRCAV